MSELDLIEALERRVAHLEILEDPIARLINGVANDATQDFTAQVFTLWNNSEIELTLSERGYIWWGYQFHTHSDTVRIQGARLQVFIDGAAEKRALFQGYDTINTRETHALVGRSDSAQAVGAHTVDVRINVVNVNDIIAGRNLTGYAFWTRQ